jgi:dihydroorotase-like cyclic amidohydrolase
MAVPTLMIRQSEVLMPDGRLQVQDVLVQGRSIQQVAEAINFTADQRD